MFPKHEIHYTFIRFTPETSSAGDALDCLSVDERDTVERFHFLEDKLKFIQRRLFYRHVLGYYCDIAPADIIFKKNKFGKPYMSFEQNTAGISFSCSSSKDIAVIALMNGGELGVDIENMIDYFTISKVSPQLFTQYEISKIGKSENGRQLFFELWTKKEALAKARGTGIAYGSLNQFDVTANPTILTEDSSRQVYINTVSITAGYAGAIAAIHDNDMQMNIVYSPGTNFMSRLH
jgi:4'-phosphopantetheinyl transferase